MPWLDTWAQLQRTVGPAERHDFLDRFIRRVQRDPCAHQAELEHLASVDDLTGLSNRRHWLSQARARIISEPGGGLLLCDVHHFKAINDRHGHRTGDLVLREIARILTRHGIAGRLGGDEFAVWVPGGRPQAIAAAAAILYDIDHELAAPGTSTGVGVSIGIALAPDDGDTIDVLLAAADAALYRAKDGGRRQAQITAA